MSIQTIIEEKLIASLSPVRLRIDNDSMRHAGPATESHFRLIIVADHFEA